ncbi:transposase [Rickettsia tamurae]|uniref:transposase n=1 Tax=Rickettsia tamurae TaxID=334545 RepID=UPI003081A689
MRSYRKNSHSQYDLKVHLIWIPKYRKRVLIGKVAERARDLLRQICMEHEVYIISGKISIVPYNFCNKSLGVVLHMGI